MRVIGTAGHVDHGKSALILALTGINPDRLREEQERQMTIDLGFAWMTMPDGEEIGFVDVPGHRDFIDNMLAGVGGIDAALFVIAADEGVMPQTREHLAILDLLEVEHAIVVLTKIDLVEDRQWLELVEEEVINLLHGTSLSNSVIVPVSAISGEGLEDLRKEIAAIIRDTKPRSDLGRPRLPIDRAFIISGFGTVVTGTLMDGKLSVGQEVEVLPNGLKGRIRGLQTHKTKVHTVIPGSRTAINLSGIDVKSIDRGDVVTLSGLFSPTRLIDVQYRHLPDAGIALKHDQQVKIFIGAAQEMARVRVLGIDRIHPGEEGWIQLVFENPIVTARGDHFIVRRPSPGATIGGGVVADPYSKRKHRRKDFDVLDRLEQIMIGSPGEILAQTLMLYSPMKLNKAIEQANLSDADAIAGIEELREKGEITLLGNGQLTLEDDPYVTHKDINRKITSEMVSILKSFHSKNPLKFGMSREELKSRSKLEGAVFPLFLKRLIDSGDINAIGTRVAIADYKPTLNDNQKKDVELLLKRIDRSPFSPPSVKQCLSAVGNDLYRYLLDSEELVQVSADVVFRRQTYESMIKEIRGKLERDGTISVAGVRDLFDTSRKYALALMEHLDESGITVRQGDVRKLVG